MSHHPTYSALEAEFQDTAFQSPPMSFLVFQMLTRENTMCVAF